MKYLVLLSTFLLFSCSKNSEDSHIFYSGFNLDQLSDPNDLDLSGITKIQGGVGIYNNDLVSLDFLVNIDTIDGPLYIVNNNALNSLSGLENLKSVKSIHIQNNDELISIDALKDVHIKENFILTDNSIASVSEFSKIKELNDVTVKERQLKDLSFLKNLESLSNDFALVSSDEIKDLDGLENLTLIDSRLIIEDNKNLTEFCGIKTCLINSSLTAINIKGNSLNPTEEEIIENCN